MVEPEGAEDLDLKGKDHRVPDLAARLLAIGRHSAAHIKEPYRSVDHGELLYDDRGLPRWSSMVVVTAQCDF
jgi:antitoxin VapB